jgi:hypothetical protein
MHRIFLALLVMLLMAAEKVDWSFAPAKNSLAKNLFTPFPAKQDKPVVKPEPKPEVYFYQQLPVIQYYYEPRRITYGTKSICVP